MDRYNTPFTRVEGESIVIDEWIDVKVTRIGADYVTIMVSAPSNVCLRRGEQMRMETHTRRNMNLPKMR